LARGSQILAPEIVRRVRGLKPNASRLSPEELDQLGKMKFSENVTILGLPSVISVLHIVCLLDSQRYYLLLTGIHRLLAPLFTIVRTYSEPQPASPP
jgi:hypothetical protein